MKIRTLFATLFLFTPLLSIQALSIDTDKFENKSIFGIKFSTELAYYGKADSVQSVSLQEYRTSSFIVTEMVIEISGTPTQLRIYHTEVITTSDLQQMLPEETPNTLTRKPPAAVQQLLDTGKKNIDEAIDSRVFKDYPTTTHAKTIEYHISNKSELKALFREFIKIYIQADEETNNSLQDSNNTSDSNVTINSQDPITQLGGVLFTVVSGESD